MHSFYGVARPFYPIWICFCQVASPHVSSRGQQIMDSVQTPVLSHRSACSVYAEMLNQHKYFCSTWPTRTRSHIEPFFATFTYLLLVPREDHKISLLLHPYIFILTVCSSDETVTKPTLLYLKGETQMLHFISKEELYFF